MRTFSVLRGLPVVDAVTGEKIGTISDLSVSENNRVEKLLIKTGNIFSNPVSIVMNDVISIQESLIIVDGSRIQNADKLPGEYTLQNGDCLLGRMLFTNAGDELGLLEDVYFMEEMGTIVGYELTDGFFSDISEGKRLVKPRGPTVIEKDAIFVNVDK
ncbi:PRC-barrel domain-containing protein [Bacillus massilinigeriensis]|uniref:PRC-barrel domain-containing protein n=1 Tax=Bacillus mediterraneensis TaxID=1805474 RepID=UPI0008F97064|nr:PRC-barrel domain-containing protein [Bacillus mediterraneensis]